MLRDSLAGLIEPMHNSARSDPLALSIQNRHRAIDPHALTIPALRAPLMESVTSPIQAESAPGLLVICQQRRGYLQAGPFSTAVSTFAAAVRVRLKQLPNGSLEM